MSAIASSWHADTLQDDSIYGSCSGQPKIYPPRLQNSLPKRNKPRRMRSQRRRALRFGISVPVLLEPCSLSCDAQHALRVIARTKNTKKREKPSIRSGFPSPALSQLRPERGLASCLLTQCNLGASEPLIPCRCKLEAEVKTSVWSTNHMACQKSGSIRHHLATPKCILDLSLPFPNVLSPVLLPRP